MNYITRFYETSLPAAVGKEYEFTSFSYLAKYWQDPIGKIPICIATDYTVLPLTKSSDAADIQQAARNLFSVTLAQMSMQQKHDIISYWRPYREY